MKNKIATELENCAVRIAMCTVVLVPCAKLSVRRRALPRAVTVGS